MFINNHAHFSVSGHCINTILVSTDGDGAMFINNHVHFSVSGHCINTMLVSTDGEEGTAC
jgi:protocatechuate 3,4-dioxygenase beta subunit